MARRPFVEQSVHGHTGDTTGRIWSIAVETPVEIGLNGAPWTVMMATPADLEDLAVGLALTERVVSDIAAIERIDVANYLDGVSVDLVLPAAALNTSARQRRSLEGRVGCGLCGVEALAGLPSTTKRPHSSSTTDRCPRRARSVRLARRTATAQPRDAFHTCRRVVQYAGDYRTRSRRRRASQCTRQTRWCHGPRRSSRRARLHRHDEPLQLRTRL